LVKGQARGGAILGRSSKVTHMTRIPELAISSEKVAEILTRARRYDVKDVVTDPDSGSNASDEAMLSVLENHADDPVRRELLSIVRGLNRDEQVDLVALTWLGRGDGELDEWDDLHEEAAYAHNRRTAEYVLGMPLLSDYLEEALAQFGHSAEEFERPL
jgi:Protein of unknown function (DUF3775)